MSRGISYPPYSLYGDRIEGMRGEGEEKEEEEEEERRGG
jgi:hypothetical protein